MESDRKRKIEDSEVTVKVDLKKHKKSSDEETAPKNLLDYFADEILIEILNKLDSESLFSLSE